MTLVAPFFGSSSDARQHPWTVTTYSPEYAQYSGKYYDLRNQPELIETSLEDFLPYSDLPAIRRFYEFLHWINGEESNLETNDSAFQPPRDSETDIFDFPLQCDGRVEIVHRDMTINTSPEKFYKMVQALAVFLQLSRPAFAAGFVELSHAKTVFVNQPKDQEMGARISLRFLAFGNSSNHVFGNLLSVIDTIWNSCRRLSSSFDEPKVT